MKHYCYVVTENAYPVEVFLQQEEAITFIKNWVGIYPNDRVFCFRCLLSDSLLNAQAV